jgi:hypothetical protein
VLAALLVALVAGAPFATAPPADRVARVEQCLKAVHDHEPGSLDHAAVRIASWVRRRSQCALDRSEASRHPDDALLEGLYRPFLSERRQ